MTMEIAPGDKVLAIDNTEIEDIFDYQFLTQDTYIEMLTLTMSPSISLTRR